LHDDLKGSGHGAAVALKLLRTQNMLSRVNWYLVLGVVFLVAGILYLFIPRWLEAGWSLTLGFGNFYVAYAQKHPQFGRGPLAWAVAIIFLVVMIGLTILKLRGA
jgi:hypothetical protein